MAAAVKGYDTDTMGEDMELVVKLHSFCRINKSPLQYPLCSGRICWSQCPSSIKDLKKQRRRWYLGLFQCLSKHHRMFLAPEFGVVGYVSYLYYLLYELLSPFIELFGLLTIILAYAVNLINVPFMVLFFHDLCALRSGTYNYCFFLQGFIRRTSSCSFLDVVKSIYLCISESVFFRFIQAFTRMTAFIGYRKRKCVGQIQRQKIQLKQSEEQKVEGKNA